KKKHQTRKVRKEKLKIQRREESERRKTEKEIMNFEATFRCALCYDVFYRPVMLLQCRHVFCELCIQRFILRGLQEFSNNYLLCSLCRNPILDIPIPATHRWMIFLISAQKFWSKDQLRTHIRINKEYWTKHIFENF